MISLKVATIKKSYASIKLSYRSLILYSIALVLFFNSIIMILNKPVLAASSSNFGRSENFLKTTSKVSFVLDKLETTYKDKNGDKTKQINSDYHSNDSLKEKDLLSAYDEYSYWLPMTSITIQIQKPLTRLVLKLLALYSNVCSFDNNGVIDVESIQNYYNNLRDSYLINGESMSNLDSNKLTQKKGEEEFISMNNMIILRDFLLFNILPPNGAGLRRELFEDAVFEYNENLMKFIKLNEEQQYNSEYFDNYLNSLLNYIGSDDVIIIKEEIFSRLPDINNLEGIEKLSSIFKQEFAGKGYNLVTGEKDKKYKDFAHRLYNSMHN